MGGIGPMAHTVEGLELLFSIIAGPDGRDTEVRPVPVDDVPELALNIRHSIEDLVHQLNRLGAVVKEVLPGLDFNKDVSRAGELIGMVVGAFQPQENIPPTTLAQYMEALHRRDQAIITCEQFFDDWDVLLCPASMTTAFPYCKTGSPLQVDGQKVVYWMVSAYSTMFNYTGHRNTI